MAVSLTNGLTVQSKNKLWDGVQDPQIVTAPASLQLKATGHMLPTKFGLIIPNINFDGEVSPLGVFLFVRSSLNIVSGPSLKTFSARFHSELMQIIFLHF